MSENNNSPVLDNDTVAAISLALSMYLKEAHDYEKMNLTIKKVIRPYSPWSSKIYGLRQVPMKYPSPWAKF